MKYWLIIIAQLTTLAAGGYVYLGHEYLTIGYGLHPMLSGAIALSSLAIPFCFAAWTMRDRDISPLELTPEEVTTLDWIKLHPSPEATLWLYKHNIYHRILNHHRQQE